MFTVTKAITCFALCAWILWSRTYINNELKDVDISNAFLMLNECQDGLTDLVRRNKEQGKKVEPGIIPWSNRQYATLICLPDTVKLN